MAKQKFKHGDVVHIVKDLGSGMQHFESDMDAIVMYSYADKYGGDDIKSYHLMFCEDGHEVSWYYEHQLVFLRHGEESEIEKIKFLREKRAAQESDIYWIVSNWIGIRDRVSGPTMSALMKLVGITDPWGPHGEGYVLYQNQMATFHFLDKALSTGKISEMNERLATIGRPPVPPQQ